MGLFGFGKNKAQEEKKEEPKGFTCSLEAAIETDEEGNIENVDARGGIKSIKILGSGCKACHILYENTKEAVAELGLQIEVEYVTDLEEVMSYGVLSIPGLAINGEVVCVGKALKVSAVKNMLSKLEK